MSAPDNRMVPQVQFTEQYIPSEDWLSVSRVFEKAAELSEFDKGQIVLTRCLGTSISETAHLVGCSCVAVVNMYQKWCTDTSSQGHNAKNHQQLQQW